MTLENHTVVGGLGSATAEVMAEAGLAGKRLLRLGLRDRYAHGASRRYLMREHGLDAEALIAGVEELTGSRFDVCRDELEAVGMPVFETSSSAEQAEAADARVEDL